MQLSARARVVLRGAHLNLVVDRRRQGFGRYRWNDTDFYEGHYANDVPHGFGTATLASEAFAGDWQHGCLRKGDRVVAIGVSRQSRGNVAAAAIKGGQSAGF